MGKLLDGLEASITFYWENFSNGVRIDLGIDLHSTGGVGWLIVIFMHSSVWAVTLPRNKKCQILFCHSIPLHEFNESN